MSEQPANSTTSWSDHLGARRHLSVGWWSLLLFATLGVLLEALHGFKVGAYLDGSNETRRLMWTLAHAHGNLLALVHIAFAFTSRSVPGWTGKGWTIASRCLHAALVLIPVGFFLGGLVIYGGDPGVGIFLVPPGALLLLVGLALTGLGLRRQI